MVLKNVFRSTVLGLRTWSVFSGARQGNTVVPAFKQPQCSFYTNWTLTGICKRDEILLNQPVRQYARPSRKKQEFPSQLQDLHPSMLKHEYASVPLAQSTVAVLCHLCRVDDVVKKLLTLELANHSEKLRLKEEQLIAKVQRDENDRSSTEVKVAILTARIRNLQEHLHKHPKDKANKRRMLMAIDRRKKKLKVLRMTRYESFEKVCQELGITYTFPPEYYRRVTRRWLAKKAFCNKVFQEVQKQKAEQREKQRAEGAKGKEPTSSTEPQETVA
ncbi:small ribosomal subunit protein uS15m isoform X2 [Onychostoma macrolepis]|uniref:small ribosomal subunit protein uS15m isoform X2 n=1 Tax=Onychostoma macrolepis TaxID=369639 RepID=UPI0027299C59|nr:small ribosomal subunit protein uS15m isoform X2 [Onychostoma macrolepis]